MRQTIVAFLNTYLNTAGKQNVAAGLLAGLVARIVCSIVVALPYGFGLNLLVTLALGAIFGLILGPKIRTAGAGLIWGQSFGLLWWLFGSLTLMPLLSGMALPWTLNALQAIFPELLGWTVGFGVTLGLSFYWIRFALRHLVPLNAAAPDAPATADPSSGTQRRTPTQQEIVPPLAQSFIVGGLGGLFGSWVFAWGVDRALFFPLVAGLMGSSSTMVGGTLHYLIGGAIGITFGPSLQPRFARARHRVGLGRQLRANMVGYRPIDVAAHLAWVGPPARLDTTGCPGRLRLLD